MISKRNNPPLVILVFLGIKGFEFLKGFFLTENDKQVIAVCFDKTFTKLKFTACKNVSEA